VKVRSIYTEDEVYNQLKQLAKKEGRLIGKMLEILIEEYKKSKGE